MRCWNRRPVCWLCRLQAQVVQVGQEITIAEQQWQVGLQAGRGNDPIDRFVHRDPLPKELAVVLRSFPCIVSSQHRQQCQRAEQPAGRGHVALVAKALNHFHQDQITHHQRRHPKETITPAVQILGWLGHPTAGCQVTSQTPGERRAGPAALCAKSPAPWL